jgi:hypothetical protein
MTVVASHQPPFLPWPGFWHKFLSADVFVMSAGVRWANDSFLNRIMHEGTWVTVPVQSHRGPIVDVRIAHSDKLRDLQTWADMLPHRRRYRYGNRLRFVGETMLEYMLPDVPIYAMNLELIERIARLFGAKTKVIVDTARSEVGMNAADRLMARLRRNVPDVTEYLAGSGADYIDQWAFGVPHRTQDARQFEPSRSIIDVIGTEPFPAQWILEHGGWR